MKNLILIILLIISTPILANEGWYVGIGGGSTNFNHDLDKDIDRQVNRGNDIVNDYVDDASSTIINSVEQINNEIGYINEEHNLNIDYVNEEDVTHILNQYNNQSYFTDALNYYQIPVTHSSNFYSQALKLFVGYDFGNRFKVELSLNNYGSYDAHAEIPTASIDEKMSYKDIDSTLNGSAYANGYAKAKAYGISLATLFNVIDTERTELFIRGGIERGFAEIETKFNYGYEYSYSYDVDNHVNNSDNSSKEFSEHNVEHYTAYVPVIGAGLQYKINDNYGIRSEFKRVGDPRQNGTKIDTYTLNVIKYF